MVLRDIVEEAGKRSSGVVAHVLELGHQLVSKLLVDDGHLEIDWFRTSANKSY